MIRKLLHLGTCAVLASATILPDLAMAQPANNTPVMRISANNRGSQRITLGLNKAEVIELDSDVKDVDVAAPEIADAVVKSPRRILLIAQKVGQTNIFFTDSGGRRILSLDVQVERDTTDLATLMREAMPNSAIKVTSIADNVVLAGNVSSALEASRAVNLATGFAGDPKKVVNMLSVAGGQQVLLKVRIAEMSRSIAKQFGINASAAVNVGGVPILPTTTNPYGLLGRALADASGAQIGSVCPQAFTPHVAGTNVTTTTDGVPSVVSTITSTIPCASPNNAQGILNGLERVGLIHVLSDPDLVSANGETAKTLVGGSFPVPTAKDNQGNVTVEFKDYGVGLSFTPIVLSPDHIVVQLSTEVSEPSTTGAFQLQGGTQTIDGVTTTAPGLTIPGLTVRRASTTVEMPSGGSFAIAGLMQHVNKQVIDGFPGLKDMPVLGAMFRSRDYQNDETELVIMASVYLVQPNAASAFSAPTDGFVPPSDPETLLLGRLNATYKQDEPVGKSAAAVGFIVQ